ncbi:2,3 cyclic phosphodiesterase [Metschnikowia bicuspidata var. bicuspidata NRRL YB-4993]|uniref:2',3'-cyclic-nucleotide 3'-phosphodiesterase n=1 Tax=Metschnikowia bicuspidata var. bicuspidata NRRL YB-4993 TaxID=869754 RepID=A0A1A0HBX3_9ASCO|nr:2,3 cyclic phosphodiesterase [Metschnikowia bicuspidata var. bicuspidata NRRL YB-4993]OBA21511.1 2,3 cyclic phosphodiesterase [Metschnikowia bicuspidata var. bicuspidata NRRL YB-4993]
MGVALWLCPKKNTPLYDKLQVLMNSLSTVFPGLPPRFEPHITITSNVAVDLANAKDDVDRILLACCIALDSLPRDSSDPHWIHLGRVASQKRFFKKLYFQVLRDPTLVSFARIVRELFVVLPERTELEHKVKNPHLFHTDHLGNIVRRKPGLRARGHPHVDAALDHAKIQSELAHEAASWSAAEFDPHLSLVYSDLHPIDNALWHTIRSRVSDYLSLEDCDLEEWDVRGNGLSWEGGVLKLVLCEGDVNEWPVLGSVDLHM